MKKIIFYLTIIVFTTSCSHHIARTGYTLKKTDYVHCNITIKNNMFLTDSLQKVGEIKLGETGFSVACSEAHAIEILKKEGCALNANIINITEEKRPDLWSSCYRCSATFYKYTDADFKIESDYIYKTDYVDSRVNSDRSRTAGAIIGAFVGVVIISLLIL